MTSQLCHNFQASQAVHRADDFTSPNFYGQVNSLSVCGPGWSAQPYSVKFCLNPRTIPQVTHIRANEIKARRYSTLVPEQQLAHSIGLRQGLQIKLQLTNQR